MKSKENYRTHKPVCSTTEKEFPERNACFKMNNYVNVCSFVYDPSDPCNSKMSYLNIMQPKKGNKHNIPDKKKKGRKCCKLGEESHVTSLNRYRLFRMVYFQLKKDGN